MFGLPSFGIIAARTKVKFDSVRATDILRTCHDQNMHLAKNVTKVF